MKLTNTIMLALVLCISACATTAKPKIKALIIDGQNNHGVWPKSTMMVKQYLEETGKFTVDVQRTQYTWRGAKRHLDAYPLSDHPQTEALDNPKADPDFSPNFQDYDVVISNFGWKASKLPQQTQKNLETFVESGGGLVVIHAADNAWPNWLAFNKMIGLGGWGGRNEKSGPYVYYNNDNVLVRDTSPGHGGGHGPQREFQITIRDQKHPITRGMPPVWMHTKDELYEKLRGPAENMTILATSYSNADPKGEGRHEPMMMVLDYGKGRIFHTPLGHDDYSFESVGLIVSIQRGTEWAATGKVNDAQIPKDFPSAESSSARTFSLSK